MSDQLIVERGGLEKKDKSELQTIVRALGGTVSSRARKADLIDRILELAGAATEGDDDGPDVVDDPPPAPVEAEEPSAGRTAASGSPNGGRDGSPSQRSQGGSRQRGPSRSSGAADSAANHPVGPDGEPLADWEIAMMEDADSDQPQSDRSRTRSRADQRDRSAANRSDGPRSDGPRSDGPRSDGPRSDGPRSDKGEAPATNGSAARPDDRSLAPGDDSDPNNRRTRRRSRGRGRDRDEISNDPVSSDPIPVDGYLDLREEGYGFLRVDGNLPSKEDVYVSVKQVRQYGLRRGDRITGLSRPANRNEKNPGFHQIDTVNGSAPDEGRYRVHFDDLTPVYPDERLTLELAADPVDLTTRIIDLVAPIGKGQRGLILSASRAGKTTILKQIARAIEINDPETQLLVILLDERPEDVTDWQRHLERGEVVASTFDRPPEEHTAVAELTIERAKRMAEQGDDVVVLLDGLTSLARAYNLAAPQGNRSGGIVDAGALHPAKRFFGAARNLEEGGSLTILATAGVETGSPLDKAILDEFEGTANMELKLDRRLADKRIFPAIDVDASSTNHEELLFDETQLQQAWKLRRSLSERSDEGGPTAAIEYLIEQLAATPSNTAFLAEIGKAASV